jgi:hypothetical protein
MLGDAWKIVVPTYSIEKGALKGTQMRFDAPVLEAAGDVKAKPAVKGHRTVIGSDVPTKDSVIEFRFRLGGAQSVTAEFDDRAFNGSHYGHLCMARISVQGIILTDQKAGGAKSKKSSGQAPRHCSEQSQIQLPLVQLLITRPLALPRHIRCDHTFAAVLPHRIHKIPFFPEFPAPQLALHFRSLRKHLPRDHTLDRRHDPRGTLGRHRLDQEVRVISIQPDFQKLNLPPLLDLHARRS